MGSFLLRGRTPCGSGPADSHRSSVPPKHARGRNLALWTEDPSRHRPVRCRRCVLSPSLFRAELTGAARGPRARPERHSEPSAARGPRGSDLTRLLAADRRAGNLPLFRAALQPRFPLSMKRRMEAALINFQKPARNLRIRAVSQTVRALPRCLSVSPRPPVRQESLELRATHPHLRYQH